MGRRITLMLTALLAIATILFIVIYLGGLQSASENEPLPDYTVMNRAELSALVLVNPNWHEPRGRLTHLLLEEENAVTALQHMLVLAWADWDMADLQAGLIQVLHDNPMQADACLALLAEQRTSWLWPKELAVQIATIHNQADVILDNLPALLQNDPHHPQAEAALSKYLGSDPVTAWEIAKLMGADALGEVVYSIINMSAEDQTRIVPVIAEKYPDLPLATILEASLAGGNAGLEMLMTLEDKGFDPWNPGQYSQIKLNLLLQAMPKPVAEKHVLNLDFADVITRAKFIHHLSEAEQSLILDVFLIMESLGHEPPDSSEYSFVKYPLLQAVVPRQAHERSVSESYFNYLLSEHLFYIIEDWTEKLHWAGYDEYSLMLDIDCAADKLAQDPQWGHIQSVMNPPEFPAAQSQLSAENRRDQGQISRISLSPDGSQLIYFSANTIWWYDLQEQQYRLAQSASQTDDVIVHWTPDSRSFILEFRDPELGNLVQLYSANQPGIPIEINIYQAAVLGWQDNTTLLLSSESPLGYTVSSLEPQTGIIQTISSLPRQPVLTTTGKIAWAEVSDNTLTISLQGSETSYNLPREDMTIVGWLPGDRGILMRSSPGVYTMVDFASGKTAELNVKGAFIPYASGWSPENKILGSFSLGLVNHIMVLDMENMSIAHTGIVSYFGAFSGSDLYWHIYSGSIYIYKIQ